MANLKLENKETISVAGKRVSNTESHNISGINNVYQETIKLDKRPASYTYLYVAAVPPGGADDKSVYIEAYTDRSFTALGGNGVANTTVTLDAPVDPTVIGQVGVTPIAPDLRISGTQIATGDTHDDGADDRVISVSGDQTFVVGAATGTQQKDQLTFFGNQKALSATIVTGQKYITHSHVPATDIKVGMRVTGTNIGTNAVVTKIVSNVEFEVDVASTGSDTNDIFISDTIKVTFDDDVTQANSTKHIAGVSGIFGAEDNLTNRKAVLTSLKKSLDAWVFAGAPFSIGGITDNGTLPYLKITHNSPGPSANVREIYGYMIEQDYLFAADRTGLAIGQRTDVFTNESISPITILSLEDSITRSGLIARSGGSQSFSNDNVKYIRITNNGSVNSIIYTHVGSSDLKASARKGIRVKAFEIQAAGVEEGYDINGYIIDILKPGESKTYYEGKIDLIRSTADSPILTEIDNIYAISESATVNGSIEVFVASK